MYFAVIVVISELLDSKQGKLTKMDREHLEYKLDQSTFLSEIIHTRFIWKISSVHTLILHSSHTLAVMCLPKDAQETI